MSGMATIKNFAVISKAIKKSAPSGSENPDQYQRGDQGDAVSPAQPIEVRQTDEGDDERRRVDEQAALLIEPPGDKPTRDLLRLRIAEAAA